MSMTTAATENDILTHYGITSLYPDEWPLEKNEGEDDDENDFEAQAKARHTRRFTTLGHGRGYGKSKSKSPHKGRGKDDALPPLPRDEPDPLGANASVVALLRQNRVPVERNEELSMILSQVFATSKPLFNTT